MPSNHDPEPMDFFNALTKAACDYLEEHSAKALKEWKESDDRSWDAAMRKPRPAVRYPMHMHFPPGDSGE